jgi:tetratricopeptide (TPR) repeat protein
MTPCPRARFFARARNRALRCLVLLSLAWHAITLTAQAAPPRRGDTQTESQEYQQAVRTALEEFDAGNFPEARAAFKRAHALSPNARTFRGLGFVAFELRNYIEAVEYLEEALDSREKPLDGEPRRSTEALLTRARSLLGTVRIEASPRFDTLLVDGLPRELADGRTLVLEVGDHVIELRAQGLNPERRELEISGGEQLSLAFTLRPAEASATAPGPRVELAQSTAASEQRDAPAARRWYKSPWLWSALGVVLVGAGIGTYFALRPHAHTEPADPATTGNTPPGGVLHTLRSF